MKVVRPIFPPPGLNLEIPKDLTPEIFCKQIGGDCYEYAEKFETMEQVFNLDRYAMKELGIPTIQRKYIMRMRELLRRGHLTFEYLSRRTCLDKVRDKWLNYTSDSFVQTAAILQDKYSKGKNREEG